jgi:heme uptake protein IsdC
MKRLFLIIVAALLVVIGFNPTSSSAALADGTYSINYQVNKPGSSSASIANDYFAKPAKLIVQNGSYKIQLTIKNSSWVTEFSPPGGASVVSTNAGADSRTVQFSVSSLGTVTIAMQVDIDNINYHHGYSTDFVFNESSVQLIEAAQKPADNSSNQSATNNQGTSNNTSSNQSQNNGSSSNSSSSNSSSQNASQGQSSQNNAGSAQNNTSNNASNNTSGSASTSASSSETQNAEDGEVVENNEEVVDATATENQEENPETADNFPLWAVVMLFGAIGLLVYNKYKLTNN